VDPDYTCRVDTVLAGSSESALTGSMVAEVDVASLVAENLDLL